MSKLKVGMVGHNVLYQIERARQVIDAMTGNATFPTPVPTLIAVEAKVNDTEAAYNEAINGDKVKREILKLRRAEMLAMVNQLADYVSNVAAGDGEIILGSGFSVVGARQSTLPMTQVQNLRIRLGNTSGTLKALWFGVEGKKVYQIEMTTTPSDATSWITLGEPSKNQFAISGLTPGTVYTFRVRALGKDNSFGNWSSEISQMAL